MIRIPREQVFRSRYRMRIICTVEVMRLNDVILDIEDVAAISDHGFPHFADAGRLSEAIKS